MWWTAARTVQHRIWCVTFSRRPLLLLRARALNWITTYDGRDGREAFCFSSSISIQGRLQVCTSHWVSTCRHNQELDAASLPRWRMFWFRESWSIACLWDACETTSEVCIPGKIPQWPILPFSGAAQQTSARSLSDSSRPPSSDAISLPSRCIAEPCGSCLAPEQASRLQEKQEHMCPGPQGPQQEPLSTLWAVSGPYDRIPRHPQTE